MSRPRNTKSIEKVLELRTKGLSFRAIARVIESDTKTVHRWYEMGGGKVKKKVIHTPLAIAS